MPEPNKTWQTGTNLKLFIKAGAGWFIGKVMWSVALTNWAWQYSDYWSMYVLIKKQRGLEGCHSETNKAHSHHPTTPNSETSLNQSISRKWIG